MTFCKVGVVFTGFPTALAGAVLVTVGAGTSGGTFSVFFTGVFFATPAAAAFLTGIFATGALS